MCDHDKTSRLLFQEICIFQALSFSLIVYEDNRYLNIILFESLIKIFWGTKTSRSLFELNPNHPLGDDFAIEKLSDNVYVTFDVDGFDPSIMPATGTPEPNGLLWHETMTLLRKLGKTKNIVGCDVFELAPIAGLHHPDLTTAKLVSKVINYFVK